MGASTLQATDDVARNGLVQVIPFRNTFTASASAFWPTSGWTTSLGPNQVGGAVGGFGTLDGAPRICTNATTGALQVAAPATGKTLFLSEIEAYALSGGATGHIFVFDKLADVLLTNATTALPGGVLDATSKLNSGEGGILVPEVVTNQSAALGVVYPTYTNQSGVSHSLDPTTLPAGYFINNGIVQTAPLILGYAGTPGNVNGPWYPFLAAGDTGVRTMTNLTASGTVAGTVNWSICRLVAHCPLETLLEPVGRDLRYMHPLLRPLRSDPCLFFVFFGVAANSTTVHGKLKILSL